MRIGYAFTPQGKEFVFSSRDSVDWVSTSQLGLSINDFTHMVNSLDRIDELLTVTKSDILGSEAKLMAPVPAPGKILAIGHNYLAHVAEVGKEVPTEPYVFGKYVNSLCGPEDPVEYPQGLSTQLDYECELAVIIGKRTKNVDEEQGMESVFGYAVANDISTRDLQKTLGQISLSKGMDSFCPMGPWLTTKNDVSDPQKLKVQSHVNGEPRQNGNTSDMVFSVAQLVAYISRFVTLNIGDIILTGTPAGVGMGFEPPRFLEEGDVITCSIAELGSISNQIVGNQ